MATSSEPNQAPANDPQASADVGPAPATDPKASIQAQSSEVTLSFRGYAVQVKVEAFRLTEFYQLYRGYVEHQYELLNHRTNWFIGVNAFLLTTYGFTLQKKLEVTRSVARIPDNFPHVLLSVDAFLFAISLFELFLSMLVIGLVIAAIRPVRHLHEEFKKFGAEVEAKRTESDLSQITGYIPNIIGGLSSKTLGPTLTMFIPVLVLVTWGGIFLFITDYAALFHGR